MGQDRIRQYAGEKVWAVVGAGNDRRKFGNRIYRTLRDFGYTVYPVSLREPLIEGAPAYRSLSDLPEVPAVVDVVIPPSPATLELAHEAKRLGVKALWFQPGAEWPEAIRWAEANGLDVVEDCILIHHVEHRP